MCEPKFKVGETVWIIDNEVKNELELKSCIILYIQIYKSDILYKLANEDCHYCEDAIYRTKAEAEKEIIIQLTELHEKITKDSLQILDRINQIKKSQEDSNNEWP